MTSEAWRGAVRIGSNYLRVFAVVGMGLLLVPLVMASAGETGWALVAFLGTTIGLGSIIQDALRGSLIRELGAAWHVAGDEGFMRVYNASLAISAAFAVVLAAVMVAVALIVPFLNIPPDLHAAARWLVLIRGAELTIGVITVAPVNMYKIAERMVAFNNLLVIGRVCYVVGALVPLALGIRDPSRAIVVFVSVSSALVVLTNLCAAALLMRADRRTLPRPSLMTRDAIKTVLSVGGWNAGSNTAAIMHRQIGPIIQNLALGLKPGNLVLQLSIQLTVAVRRLTAGMTEGLDAVSTRLATTSPEAAMKALLRHSTRLHGFATFPVAVGVILLADPVLRVWVMNRLDPATANATIRQVIVLTYVSIAGMVVRAISDGWLRILYGAGHVSSFAPLLIMGAVLNPLLAIFLLWVMPGPLRYTAVSWSFTIVVVIFHGLIAPLQGGRRMGVPLRDFYLPLLRPLVISIACAPVMYAVDHYLPVASDLVRLLGATAAYSIVYLAACGLFALDREERTRFTRALLRRVSAQRG